ncbi:MAG TPA: Crp/Fnr family transcriptional regulator [Bacteroidales bacterium]|nr:Crp/Fnr family transcriptional regulator [Bacteroidales bacterium]
MQYNNPFIELCLEGPSSILRSLNQKDKETLNQHHTILNIKKGKQVFNEGEKTKGLLCLASGKVKVYREGVGGREQIVKLVKPQGFIGYRTLFSEPHWLFSATALEDTSVCVLDKTTLIKILKKNPDLTIKFMKLLTDELVFANQRIVSLTQKHIRGRLAESLLMLRDTYGLEPDGRTIKVLLSREDVANLSNMTTSNAIRTLSNMASEGIIELRGRRISILNSSDLEHISGLG